MKKIISFPVFFSLLFLFYIQAMAEVPQMINYQGKLTKTTGAPLDTAISMVFTIYADSGGATSLWTEIQTGVLVEKGVFNVLLGGSTPIPYSVFDGAIRYLGVKVGDDPEITPRKPIVSVAYAYNADMLDGRHAVEFIENQGKSNLIFSMLGCDTKSGDHGLYIGAEASPNPFVGGVYAYWFAYSDDEKAVAKGKFKKISSITTVTIYCMATAGQGGSPNDSGYVKVDIGGQNNLVRYRLESGWKSFDIEVSSLNNGVVYDITIKLCGPPAATIQLYYLFAMAS